MAVSKGVYGEAVGEWTPQDALGFSKIVSLTGMFHARAGELRRKVRRWRMRSVVVDKIASVTQACGLRHEVRVATDNIPAEEGVVVVVEVLTNKSTYNTLELTSGRMAKVEQGRHRRGRARPSQGAVRLLGPCAQEREARRHHPDAEHRRRAGHLRLGEPGQGQALRLPRASAACCISRTWASASACRRAWVIASSTTTPRSTPTACPWWRWPAPAWKPARPRPPAAIISRMRHRGLVVDAFKATGVSLRRDILAFEDAGARNTLIFTDFGIVSTTRKVGPALTRTMLTELCGEEARRHRVRAGRWPHRHLRRGRHPRVEDIRKALTGVVLSANDPVAAYGGVKHPAQEVRHRARRGHRPVHGQRRGRADHPGADQRAGVQRARQPAPRWAIPSSSQVGLSRSPGRSNAASAEMSTQDSRHRARRHRLCVRRAAAPDRRPSELQAGRHPVRQPAG